MRSVLLKASDTLRAWTHPSEDVPQVELGGAIRANWDYDGPSLLDQAGRLSEKGE